MNATETPVVRALGDEVTDFIATALRDKRVVYLACVTGGEIRAWSRRLQTLHPDAIIVRAETVDEFHSAVTPDNKYFNVLVTQVRFATTGWADYHSCAAVTATDVLSEDEALQLAARVRNVHNPATVFLRYRKSYKGGFNGPKLTLTAPNNYESTV